MSRSPVDSPFEFGRARLISACVVRLKRNHPSLYRFVRLQVYGRLRSRFRRRVFTRYYRDNLWDGTYSRSGPGSTLQATEAIRATLPALLSRLDARSILDIPCGDFEWMKYVRLNGVRYTGADLVADLVERNRAKYSTSGSFVRLDLLKDVLPPVDVIFCRDCLIHLSNRDILAVIRNIARSRATFLVTTTFPGRQENEDTVAPYWRPLNLERPPFNFPPAETYLDDSDDKFLGVWRVADLALLPSQGWLS